MDFTNFLDLTNTANLSVIIAFFCPFLLTFLTNVTNILLSFVKKYFETLNKYIIDKMLNYYYGNILHTVTVSNKDQCYEHLNQVIYNSDLVEEYYYKIDAIINFFNLEKKINSDNYNLETNYSNKEKQKLSFSKNYDCHKTVRKIKFKGYVLWVKKIKSTNENIKEKKDNTERTEKNNFPGERFAKYDNSENIKITSKKVEDNNDIIIELRKGGTKSLDHKNIINEFINEQINLSELIEYTYYVKIERHTSSLINMIENIMTEMKLPFCDNSFDDKKMIDNLKYFVSDIVSESLTTVENKNQINIRLDGQNASTIDKYVEEAKIKGISGTCKFCYNGMLIIPVWYIPCGNVKKFKVIIVSHNKLSKDDINGIVLYFIRQVNKCYNNKINLEKNSKIPMTIYSYDGPTRRWKEKNTTTRSLETVYLDEKLKNHIKNEINVFVTKRPLYENSSIPYKKGLLFEGPPGTGKTSLVKAISFDYQFPIYTLNVNDRSINDNNISEIINSIPGDGIRILLFEDIDAAFDTKEVMAYIEKKDDYDSDDMYEDAKKKKNTNSNYDRLTYSGLLNSIDGISSGSTGIFIIMTSNHIEKLGDALIRAGRIDYRYHLGECNKQQLKNIFYEFLKKCFDVKFDNNNEQNKTAFYGDNFEDELDDLCNKIIMGETKVKPCDVIYHIIRYSSSFGDIKNNINEIL